MRVLKALAITGFLMAATLGATTCAAAEMALVRCEFTNSGAANVTGFASSSRISMPASLDWQMGTADCTMFIKYLVDSGYSIADSHYATSEGNLRNTSMIYRLMK